MDSLDVYKAISGVQGALAVTGIAKGQEAPAMMGGYKFRGIDDVYAALAPLLSEHGLVILPRISLIEAREGTTDKGKLQTHVFLRAEFDLVAVSDGSCHSIATVGEAMDVGSDKATNQAMSAAYKNMAFLTFAIPTEGDNDSESSDHQEAQPKNFPQQTAGADYPSKKQIDYLDKLLAEEDPAEAERCWAKLGKEPNKAQLSRAIDYYVGRKKVRDDA